MREQTKLSSAGEWLSCHGYWEAQGQPWRTEPEINKERKEHLEQCRSIDPDIARGVYPFKGEELNRADIEWLLATHDGGRGPVYWNNKNHQERKGLDLRGANLHRADLCGLPLARTRGGLNWEEMHKATREQIKAAAVNMEGAFLEATHLEGADLVGVSLRDANLRRACLSGANLHAAHLERAILHEAQLERANLHAAHLERAILHEAYLERTNLWEAHMEGCDLRRAYLSGANLHEIYLERANLCGADLEEADLQEAHLEMANLSRTNLRRTQLAGAYMLWATLSEADLREANLAEAQLELADLRGAHLEEADLHEAYLKQTNLCKAYLQGANLTTVQLIRANLQEAYLGEADLRGTHLEQANLCRAYLGNADLRGAFFDAATNLKGVSFGDEKHGHSSLADLHWERVNLSVVDWPSVTVLGDERRAQQSKQINAYQEAIRANHQLAVALREQGLNEQAAYFSYRAHGLHRAILRLQRKFGSYLFSLFLDLLAGHGYRPWRSAFVYMLVVLGFAIGYYEAAQILHAQAYSLTWYEALILSVSAFHGRGFFQPIQNLGDPMATLAAIEAILGLLIEISFVAAFTQRFFGK